ncbi:uncharacterized protein LOC110183623 [Drosophila serrata]|uniref:uncharacterized protein LOC110183623 n=1 Tax=Drosophila serrata TaxID=7274 RepID=UPI000A1CF6D0|nr:uncharacterized protein LOC110183623 [Drosophila serrata]
MSSKKIEVRKSRLSGSGDYYSWLESEKKRKRAEANRRYREKKNKLKPHLSKTRAKTHAEHCREYRERKKLQAKAETITYDDPESDQYEENIPYEQFLPQDGPQNAKNSQETIYASSMNLPEIEEDHLEEIQTESEDSKSQFKRSQFIPSSVSEMSFDELLEDSVQDSTSTRNQSESDGISISDIAPKTESFENMSAAEKAAEAARRYRLIKKMIKPIKPSALTAAQRSKAYRDRQKNLQYAAKIKTGDSKTNINNQAETIRTQQINTNVNIKGQLKDTPKTVSEKNKERRDRQRSLIMAAIEELRQQEIQKNINSVTNGDPNESISKINLRSVLTQDECVAAIRQYDIQPLYDQVAQNFNCTVQQIMSVMSNRKAILEFNETTITLSQKGNEDSELRRRKLNLFSYCLYEYTQRAQYHLNEQINEELILEQAINFRDLMAIDSFTPNKSYINQFMAAYDVNRVNCLVNIPQKTRMSLDLKNIMTHCVRHCAMAPNLQPRVLTPIKIDVSQLLKYTKALKNQTEIEPESDNDVEVIPNECNEDSNDSIRIPSFQSTLSIEKVEHSPIQMDDYQDLDVDMDVPEIATPPMHNLEISDEEPLPHSVETFKDALRLLKPLEDFALMRESYRVIGLLSQLEQIFEAGKKAEEMGTST